MAEIVLRRGEDAERRRSLVTPEGVDLSLASPTPASASAPS